jgi:short-subunit dehydrogenase
MPSLAEGASAVVTGATRGIGLAVAHGLAMRGARVALVARSRARLEQAAREVGGTAFAADVISETEVAQLAEQLKSHFGDAPDIIVNAAGAFDLGAIAETSVAAFNDMIAANLRGPFLLMRAFLPRMLERRSGHILSIGSIAGRHALPGNGAYSASKFGLRGLHEVLALELKGSGVRATLVEPAATDTPLWDGVDRVRNPGLPERSDMLSPAAVAECVLFALATAPAQTIKYMGIERS